MGIGNYYRKFPEKSRSRWGRIPRIDLFLFFAALAVFTIVIVSRVVQKPAGPKFTEIYISSTCEEFFGRDIIAALIQEFEGQNPDMRILTTGIAQGGTNNADIVFFDDTEFTGLIRTAERDDDKLSLVSLSPYIHNEPRTEQRAVPLVFFMDLFFYNVDILKTAGNFRPPKTRDEFISTARAVAKTGEAGEKVYSLGFGLNQEDPLALRRDIYPWIWAGREAASDIITFFGQLNREGLLAPGTFEKNGAQRLKEFAEGKIAMMAGSARDIPFLRNAALNINFSITSIPAMGFEKNRLGLSGIYAGISNNCTLQDEAWTFLAFIAGKKQILSAAIGAIPGIFPGIIPGEHITKDPLYSKAWEIFEASDIVEFAPDQPGDEESVHMIWERLREALVR